MSERTVWHHGIMATRKMIFSLPVDLADRILRRVPARDRSRFLAKALEKSLREEEAALVSSCRSANLDRDATAIEEERDQIRDR